MKILIFLILFLLNCIVYGQNLNLEDSLIIGKWKMISHFNTPKKIVNKYALTYHFNDDGTYVIYEGRKIMGQGKWKIKNNSLAFFDNIDGYWSELDYKIYLLNKSTLVFDEVFYFEELAKSTYRRIK